MPATTRAAEFLGGTNYNNQSNTAAIVIAKADATVVITPYSGTYDAAAHNLSGSVTGVAGDLAAVGSSLTFGPSFTDAGNHTGSWSFLGGTNYNNQSNTAAIVIAKADATVVITPYSGTYDAAAHNLSGSVTGVVGDLAAVGSSLTFGPSFTDAGNHTGSWSFLGGTNYNNQSNTAAIVIAKADATVVITPYSGTYDAAAHNLSGSVTGVVGDLAAVGSSLTFGPSFTDAGNHTGSWSFLGGTNYNNQSNTAAIVIAKADATVVITPYSGTYDAAAHNLSGSVTGVVGDLAAVGSSLTFGPSFTDAGNHTGSWSFLGGTNYNNQSNTAAIVIAKADATVVITPYSGTYDAAAHNLSGSVTGVVGDLAAVGSSLTFGPSFTDAGNHTGSWSFLGGTNYNNQSNTAAIVIAKADATVVITPYSGTYDAAAHNLSGSVTGVVGDLAAVGSSLTFGPSFTDAGNHTGSWSFLGGTNYNNQSNTAAIVIAKADLIINVSNLSKTFGQTINLASVLGTTVNTGINNETLAVSHSCAGASASALVGSYSINCVVSGDGTGKASNYNVYSVTFNSGMLTVTTPSLITAVQDGGNLIIVGTEGADTIDVNANNPSAVSINGKGSYSVSPSGHVIVYGMGSADNINLTGNVNLEAHGGYGNDTITGGAGNDVLFGDAGDDTLTGSAGNDVLVGGTGADRLVGSAGHDMLIAGELTGDHNGSAYDYTALRAIDDQWAANFTPDTDLANNTGSDVDVVDESADQLTGTAAT